MDKRFLAGIVGAAIVLALAFFMFAEDGPSNGAQPSGGTSAALLEAGPQGDTVLGQDDAPITVIEYASMTCSHCATFHTGTFPEVEENYIKTGKVRFILRDYPFDPIATAGAMLARCAGQERYFNFVSVLMDQQRKWAFVEEPLEALKGIARQGGFSEESYEACLANQDIFEHVRWVQTRASDEFGVRSTPTFFVNGEKVEGALSFNEFEAILKKHLGEAAE